MEKYKGMVGNLSSLLLHPHHHGPTHTVEEGYHGTPCLSCNRKLFPHYHCKACTMAAATREGRADPFQGVYSISNAGIIPLSVCKVLPITNSKTYLLR